MECPSVEDELETWGFLTYPPALGPGSVLFKGASGGSAEGVHRASLVLVLLRMRGLGNKERLKLWK